MQAGVVGARIGSIEVGLLSLRIVEVSVGIGQCQIVDCMGYLSIGLVGWQGLEREMAHGFRVRGPLVWTGVRKDRVSASNGTPLRRRPLPKRSKERPLRERRLRWCHLWC